ncbi:hypothetical protein ACLB2K_013683 [Fragaria x ananassa]
MSYSTTVALANPAFPPNSNSKLRNPQNRKELISLLQKCRHCQIPQIHAKIIRNGQDQDPFIVFELLRLCPIDYASKVFRRTQSPNVYLYTALIDGFVSSGHYMDAVRLYFEMVNEYIFPDKYVITSVLKACGFGLAVEESRQVHAQALKLGLSSNRSIRLKLMGVYGKCREFESARQGFDEMSESDAVAATVMITSYAVEESRQVHAQALKLGLSSNRSIRLKLMGVYGKCREFESARQGFDEMSESDAVAATVMITSYADHGLVDEASGVFGRLREKDTVCWTAMIDGLVKNGEMNRALEVFREMQRENVRPNEVTLVCVLSACSQLGALELGRWARLYMEKNKIECNYIVGGALINMYSRCGDIDGAVEVFSRMKERDVSTHNSMIEGFGMHGKSTMAIEMFREMMERGLRPNSITFVKVLNACSHGGLVELG